MCIQALITLIHPLSALASFADPPTLGLDFFRCSLAEGASGELLDSLLFDLLHGVVSGLHAPAGVEDAETNAILHLLVGGPIPCCFSRMEEARKLLAFHHLPPPFPPPPRLRNFGWFCTFCQISLPDRIAPLGCAAPLFLASPSLFARRLVVQVCALWLHASNAPPCFAAVTVLIVLSHTFYFVVRPPVSGWSQTLAACRLSWETAERQRRKARRDEESCRTGALGGGAAGREEAEAGETRDPPLAPPPPPAPPNAAGSFAGGLLATMCRRGQAAEAASACVEALLSSYDAALLASSPSPALPATPPAAAAGLRVLMAEGWWAAVMLPVAGVGRGNGLGYWLGRSHRNLRAVRSPLPSRAELLIVHRTLRAFSIRNVQPTPRPARASCPRS